MGKASDTSRNLFSDLAWLPEAPSDFRILNRALADGASSEPLGPQLMRLAMHALSDTQLERLAGTVRTLLARGANLAPLTPFRLGVVGTGTFDLILPALIASAVRHGVLLECVTGSYGQLVQEALQSTSVINAARCDAVLLALDHRSLPIASSLADRGSSAAACLSFIDMLRQGFRDNSGASCVVQTFAPPPEAFFGSLERRVASSTRAILEVVNQGLIEGLTERPICSSMSRRWQRQSVLPSGIPRNNGTLPNCPSVRPTRGTTQTLLDGYWAPCEARPVDVSFSTWTILSGGRDRRRRIGRNQDCAG